MRKRRNVSLASTYCLLIGFDLDLRLTASFSTAECSWLWFIYFCFLPSFNCFQMYFCWILKKKQDIEAVLQSDQQMAEEGKKKRGGDCSCKLFLLKGDKLERGRNSPAQRCCSWVVSTQTRQNPGTSEWCWMSLKQPWAHHAWYGLKTSGMAIWGSSMTWAPCSHSFN